MISFLTEIPGINFFTKFKKEFLINVQTDWFQSCRKHFFSTVKGFLLHQALALSPVCQGSNHCLIIVFSH